MKNIKLWFVCFVLASLGFVILPMPGFASDEEDLGELGSDQGWLINENSASPTGQAARTHALNSLCPDKKNKNGAVAEVIPKNGNCNINKDVTIDTTIQLASFTKLNCHGHKILPATPAIGASLSVPDVAIGANNVVGVEIENCIIGEETQPFSMGIHIQNSKRPSDDARYVNEIHDNEIAGLGVGLSLVATDGVVAQNNKVTYYRGGQGMQIVRGSHNAFIANEVRQNSLYTNVPSPAFLAGNVVTGRPTIGIFLDNLAFLPGGIITTPPVFPGVGTVMALDTGPSGLSVGNVVQGNTIYPDVGLTAVPGGRALQVSGGFKGAVIHGNTIYSGNALIHGVANSTTAFGMLISGDTIGSTYAIPGCTTALPCFYPSIDTEISNNLVFGAYSSDAIQLGVTTDAVVSENSLSGGGRAGILLSNNSLGALGVLGFVPSLNLTNIPATVTHNQIFGNGTDSTRVATTKGGIALFRSATLNSDFGAEISQNDVTGNTPRPIGVSALTGGTAYTYATELSVAGQGNYWGRACADDFGFHEFSVLPNDTPTAVIVDSHPYGDVVVGDDPLADDPDHVGFFPEALDPLTFDLCL